MDIDIALRELEKELGIKPPLGANDLGGRTRFMAVLVEIRSRICPQRERILSALNSDMTSLAIVISDVLLTSFTISGVPITTISTKIAAVGLKRFCLDPGTLLEELPKVQAEQGGADQPATAPKLQSEDKDEPETESEVRPQ